MDKSVSSLMIENLSRPLQLDPANNSVSNLRVEKEMQNQGMSIGSNSGSPAQTETFSKMLKDSMETVNVHQSQADIAIKELVAGRSKNIHETMLTVERADASLKLMMQVRNKVLDAYREIMRMQV